VVRRLFLLILFTLSLLACSPNSSQTTELIRLSGSSTVVDQYDIFEIDIFVKNPIVSNPFTEASVYAMVDDGRGKPFRIQGFCDSDDGSLFKIRLTPRKPGKYHYSVHYSDPSGAQKLVGSFVTKASERNGFLQVDPKYPHHFLWEGTRTHFFPLGNTAYGIVGLTDEKEIKASLDYFYDKGINRVRFLNQAKLNDGEFRANFDKGWNGIITPFTQVDSLFSTIDFSRYDLNHWRKMERIIRYMLAKNMVASIIMTVDRQGEFPSEGSDEELNYYLYAIARYAAFPNVTFDLGNEHNEYRDVPNWANTLATALQQKNPYGNLISAHAYKKYLYRDLVGSPWSGWQILQHLGTPGQLNAQVAKHRTTPLPIINEEFGYEKINSMTNPDEIRKKSWGIVMAGGYPTYGVDGTKGDFVTGRVTRGDGIALERGYFNHLQAFFSETEFWRFEPMNTLSDSAFVLAIPNQHYIAYQIGGNKLEIAVDASLLRPHARWYNPRSGKFQHASFHTTGKTLSFDLPDEQDWVLDIQLAKTAKIS